ncbi:hypothetical protein [Maridesulfovibrio salexigens]|uniref:Uncharacterized protein n=1 Tax=Maridesulfovibrio salexigens (strain ATCC 14822 / DSM 2638 / NCIMB 8403 / VKM B-1763) TaxID=526222 RepID=C6BT36_MARSD|nr:hypothetical protein [Maridesulfovibrio salexigens]ACS79740.1 hypothetical protein Desal_1678 [Maridesulfovibrio salexigens DSM 2638]
MADESNDLKVVIPNDLDYKFRDFFNVNASATEVVIEMGNVHRSVKNEAVLRDRVVFSVPGAIQLKDALNSALAEVERQIREAAENNKV